MTNSTHIHEENAAAPSGSLSTLSPILSSKAAAALDGPEYVPESIYVTFDSWTNWGGNLTYQPERTFHPKTLGDLKTIARLAKTHGKKIRCTGSGHSWSSTAVSKDYLVSTREMDKVSPPVHNPEGPCEGGDGWTVTIETGVLIEDLDLYLRQHNPPLTLPSNVLVGCVRYGGVLTMGTHGASVNSSTMSDMVTEMTIVNAHGELVTYSEAVDPEAFNAACLNLGLLGLIYTATLKVELMQTRMRVRDSYPRLDSIFNTSDPSASGLKLKSMVLQQDSIEFIYWPFKRFGQETFNEHIWCKQWARTTDLVPEGEEAEARKKLLAERPPSVDHPFFASFHVGEEIMEIPDAIHFPFGDGKSTVLDTGIAMKVDPDFKNVIEAFSELVEKNYEFSRSMPERMGTALELRFIRSSNKMLSPVYDEDPEAIFAMVNLMALSGTPGFEELAAATMANWIHRYNAKPHWAKMWEATPGVVPYLRQEYGPRIARFNKVRKVQDPLDMFVNATFEEFIRD
ncbi:hypothetical protein EMPS_04552 [Entomortierella parvispora]|uniref:D-arabinono-1,4-lactone oxidase n=1 Tax=Entomortierella parvispora TaxID=205924 RepID=A0A9P3H8R8_9FUNG|nr:hypothetical protein EMPS_04552 [Entomortierella parvispora]